MIRTFFKKYYFSFIFGLITITGLYFISLYNYLLYHSLVELFSIVIAFGIFIIAWNSRKFLDNNYLLFVGIAYFFIALIDLLHTLTYSKMGVFPGIMGPDPATQLWIAARYMQAASLLLAILFITRRLNYWLQLICYLGVTALIFLSIFYWDFFPASYTEGLGLTKFKVVSEYIISFMLLSALFLLHLYRKEFNRTIFMLIAASIVLTVLSELSFTLYSGPYGLFNQVGHFFKLISFLFIYKAIIETGFSQPMDLLFFKLNQSKKDIKDSEEKYHSLYCSMNEGSTLDEIIYDNSKKPVDYRILDANNSALATFGLTREQVIGKKASEVYKMDIFPYLDILAKVAESGKPVKFESFFPHLKKYFSISVFSPAEGKFATIFSDITRQKISEMEIESLSRFPLENPNPVMRVNDNNLIIFANSPAQAILKQLGNEKRSKFLKLLNDSVSDLSGKKVPGLNTVELKIKNSIYEFTVTYLKDFGYFNAYGKDITDMKKAERLAKRRAKEKAVNEQRNKLARELHDTVTQTLFSANLVAEIIPKLWKKKPEAMVEKLEELRSLNNVALMEMRVLLYELRPSALKDENLGNLIQGLVNTVKARSKIPIELIIEGKHMFPSKIELAYYRIAQEALNNIIKHSHATRASLVLKSFPEELLMNISDNGLGFKDKKIASTSLGLAIMKERAKLAGASFCIENLDKKGTNIKVLYVKNKTKPGKARRI